VNRLQKLCAQEGRSAEDQVISLKQRLTGPSATGEVIGSPEEVIAEFVRYQQAGVDLLVLDRQLAALNWIGRNVLPRL
jgi:alkanesulfonate monooxygenase SsuD/methylene tetrahydromethanopterin reductase-like flavin-dependent oxidoreductase (luciferase family)